MSEADISSPRHRDPDPSPGGDAGRAPGQDQDPAQKQEFERPGGLLSKVDGHLVMYHDPRSVHAEQYRACRTNLTAMNRSGAAWVLAITSSRRGEGKSITAANLAACLAELPGARVCLLDLDSRSPGQADIFGIQSDVGVTELLLGEAGFKGVLRNTVIPNLDFIGAGREPENPAELLGSSSFASLVEELKRRYTWILLDTPPVHPYTDACVAASQVDGALVVVRLKETPREIVNRTIDSVTVAGGKVLGTFITGRSPEQDDLDRYDDYGVDEENWSESSEERAERARARREAEKRLRQQEALLLRRQRKQQSRDEDQDSPV